MGAASAAAAAALVIIWLFNPGPAWRISAVTGTGMARIDGAPVSLLDRGTLADRLRPGAEVVLPADAQLDLELPGLALMQITGGTRAVLPGSPGRWLGRALTASLGSGEIRIATGPGFAGTRMSVATPEMRAVVTGTTLAVLRDSSASCVCVLEGRVTQTAGGAADTVGAGFRRSVFRDGGRPLLEPIRPMETMKLGMLRDLAEHALAR
jgi:ferric-dicitrate binding protein FerR (iron transport regulator)